MMLGRSNRIAREERTIEAMVGMYCRDRHGSSGKLCPDCLRLMDYARGRLNKCPFLEAKTTCASCRVHCYRPEMREKVRIVMRHAGPRMLWRHPILAAMHYLDGRVRR